MFCPQRRASKTNAVQRGLHAAKPRSVGSSCGPENSGSSVGSKSSISWENEYGDDLCLFDVLESILSNILAIWQLFEFPSTLIIRLLECTLCEGGGD